MKELKKSILSKDEYYLNVDLNCVHLTENLVGLTLPEVSLITNISTNTIIYNPHCDGLGGNIVSGKIVFDFQLTSDMSNNDELMFIIQRNVSLEGRGLDASKVIDENSHLLNDILIELRISNKIMSEAFEVEVTSNDVKDKL